MFETILAAMRQGDHVAALAAARSAVADHPENAEAQQLLGACLQRGGDLADAASAFDAAIALAPDHAVHHFSRASLALAQGEPEAAVAGLERTLVLDPNQLGAYLLLVQLALGRDDIAEAETRLKLAQRVNADHPQVWVAEGYVARARGEGDLASRLFAAAAQADPNLHAAQLALGMDFLGRGMWPFAEQALANALNLHPVRPPATVRALVEARRQQGKAEETLAALDELLALQPADLAARGLRAQLLGATGKPEEALRDRLWLLDHHPTHVPSLTAAVNLLVAMGRGDEAVARAEAAVAKAPDRDELWSIRLALAGELEDDVRAFLERWRESQPDSVGCLDRLADFHQGRGETAEAVAFADRCLAIDPDRYVSGMVKLLAELPADPEAALARAQRMLTVMPDPRRQRSLLGWVAAALDQLGRHDEAAARWREMVRILPDLIPPPPLLPADLAPEGEIKGTLLWSPPGVRPETLLRAAQAELGQRLGLGRLDSATSSDGFGLVRHVAGHPESGSAASWRQAVESAGLDPDVAVDFIPHLDAYTLAALRGARVVALLTDPRDAFMNWLVHGSLQNYLPWPELEQAADWLAGSLEALADHRDAHGGQVLVARLDADPAEAAAAVELALGLSQPLPTPPVDGPTFPAGHWRNYAAGFAAEFERLAAVSVRLGYPAE